MTEETVGLIPFCLKARYDFLEFLGQLPKDWVFVQVTDRPAGLIYREEQQCVLVIL